MDHPAMKISAWGLLFLIALLFVPGGLWPLMAVFPIGYYLTKWSVQERRETREFNRLVERFLESELKK